MGTDAPCMYTGVVFLCIKQPEDIFFHKIVARRDTTGICHMTSYMKCIFHTPFFTLVERFFYTLKEGPQHVPNREALSGSGIRKSEYVGTLGKYSQDSQRRTRMFMRFLLLEMEVPVWPSSRRVLLDGADTKIEQTEGARTGMTFSRDQITP